MLSLQRTVLAVAAVVLTATASPLLAQDSLDRYFALIDSDQNGQVDENEWGRLPALRDFAVNRGIPLNRPMSRDDFRQLQQNWLESARERPEENQDRDRDRDDRDGDRDRDRRRDDDDDNDDRERDSSSPGQVTTQSTLPQVGSSRALRASVRSRPPIVVALPDQYRERDKNGDGQIGLYEWPRAEIPAFKKLDLNGDGFLTPRELVSPGAVQQVSLTTTTPTAPTGVGRSGFGGPGDRRDGFGRSGFGRRSSFISPGDVNARAEATFNQMDSNKDGSINVEEWQRSRFTRPQFERAGIDVSKSMPKAAFIENFVKINSPAN